jgi:hypothetical protein
LLVGRDDCLRRASIGFDLTRPNKLCRIICSLSEESDSEKLELSLLLTGVLLLGVRTR